MMYMNDALVATENLMNADLSEVFISYNIVVQFSVGFFINVLG